MEQIFDDFCRKAISGNNTVSFLFSDVQIPIRHPYILILLRRRGYTNHLRESLC